jgi:predicted MPP superfamily phosphohydrolase
MFVKLLFYNCLIMKISNQSLFCLILFSLYACSKIKKILYLSDIHLELLYNSKTTTKKEFLLKCKNSTNYLSHEVLPFDYGRYNCNPSVVLLQSALKDIYSKFPRLDLIILGGDLVANLLYDLNIERDKEINKKLYKETFKTVLNEIRKVYLSTKILPIIGNNDFYQHYQTPDPESLKEQIEVFKNMYFTSGDDQDASNKLPPKYLNKNFDETLNAGMYYSYFDNNLGIKFIVLNTNFFSIKNKKINKENSYKQLSFLEGELAKLEQQNLKCLVVSHIPAFPFYDSTKFEFMCVDEFIKKLEELMYRYKNSIIATISGHTHWSKSGVRVKKRSTKLRQRYADLNEYFFSSINLPSLSPVYYNNPGYAVVFFDSHSKSIFNIETHYADLQKTMADEEFSKNIEISPTNLFSNIFDFKINLSFSNFDSKDFYDFIYKRIENSEILKNYMLMLSGRDPNSNNETYKEYLKFLKSQNRFEDETHLKIFKCSHKILYSTEAEDCIK